jgi:RNA polymerase sigma factor (sigma-70 family)
MRSTDRYIISKCLNGDSAAFGLLVERYKEGVYALAYYKLHNFQDAEDATQEAFIKAYQKLHTLRQWDDFYAWIYAITNNICKKMIQERSKRPDKDFIEEHNIGEIENHSINSYQEKATLDLLNDALSSLSETYQQILTLYYLGGMDSDEISKFLRLSPTAIYQRLSRARSQLKKEMLDMMSQVFEGRSLPAGFTFHIVEKIKHIRVNPISSTQGLPWGISLGFGIIFTILSFSSYLTQSNPILGLIGGSILSSESKVLKIGEIPVDVVKTSNMPNLSSQQGKENTGQPVLQNSLFSSPQSQSGKWTKKADMLTARWGLSATAVNGKIYAIGGASDWGDVYYSTVEEYDPVTDKWTRKAYMPTARLYLSTVALNGKIYAIGGNMMTNPSAVEEYDPVKDKWTKKTDMPTGRYGLSTCTVNGKIYAIGGGFGWSVDKFFSTVEEYDPNTDTWVKKADMPTARAGLSTSVVNGKIYAIGGSNKVMDMNDYAGLSTVEEYDPINDKWTKKADMPTARLGASAITINDKIYAISGTDRWPATSTVEEYDSVTDKWTKKANIPTARVAFGADAIDGKIYTIGGFDGATWVSTVEEYDPEFISK